MDTEIGSSLLERKVGSQTVGCQKTMFLGGEKNVFVLAALLQQNSYSRSL